MDTSVYALYCKRAEGRRDIEERMFRDVIVCVYPLFTVSNLHYIDTANILFSKDILLAAFGGCRLKAAPMLELLTGDSSLCQGSSQAHSYLPIRKGNNHV